MRLGGSSSEFIKATIVAGLVSQMADLYKGGVKDDQLQKATQFVLDGLTGTVDTEDMTEIK
jgi:hypothetical protein